MASTSEVALANLGSSRSSGYEEDGRQSIHSRRSRDVEPELEQVALAPADGGRQAWMFLLGCFSIEALIWGKSVPCKSQILPISSLELWGLITR